MANEQTKFWAKFEKQGKTWVRARLTLGLYGERKQRYAVAWLEKKYHERASHSEQHKEASSDEQIRIARSAKNAAWIAAIAAIIAAISAISAIVAVTSKD